jgi:hypothetical protein
MRGKINIRVGNISHGGMSDEYYAHHRVANDSTEEDYREQNRH